MDQNGFPSLRFPKSDRLLAAPSFLQRFVDGSGGGDKTKRAGDERGGTVTEAAIEGDAVDAGLLLTHRAIRLGVDLLLGGEDALDTEVLFQIPGKTVVTPQG